MARTGIAMVVVIVPLALLAAGCGGSSSAGAPPTTTTSTTPTGAGGAQGAAFAAFTSCLKQHGISTTGFGGGFGRRRTGTGPGATTPATTTPTTTPTTTTRRRPGTGGFFGRNLTAAQQKAFTACRAKLPAGTGRFGAGGGGFRGGAGGGTQNPAFAKYTKCLAQHGVKFGSTGASPQAFKKASAACAKLRPAVGGAPPATTTTG